MVNHGIHRKIGLEGLDDDPVVNDTSMEYESSSIDDSDFSAAFFKEQEQGDDGLEHRSPAKTLLLLLLALHMVGIIIWIRIWLRDRKIKAARMGKNTPPPQRQSCTYDVDSRFISKIELPLKALKLAKA
jgi:hypothetical protein